MIVALCLVAGWLAFLPYSPKDNRLVAVLLGSALSIPATAIWAQTDPTLGPGWAVLGVFAPVVIASAYYATEISDRLARARRKHARAWVAVGLTFLVPGLLAAWSLRPISLQTAIRYNELQRVRAMVEKSPGLVNEPAGWGTPLQCAAYLSRPEMVDLLLKHGADPNSQYGGSTPLTAAIPGCRGPDPEVIRLLLEAGADPNLPGRNGGTPLEWAQDSDSRGRITQLLIQHGACLAPPN
jgi:hypothetical protein